MLISRAGTSSTSYDESTLTMMLSSIWRSGERPCASPSLVSPSTLAATSPEQAKGWPHPSGIHRPGRPQVGSRQPGRHREERVSLRPRMISEGPARLSASHRIERLRRESKTPRLIERFRRSTISIQAHPGPGLLDQSHGQQDRVSRSKGRTSARVQNEHRLGNLQEDPQSDLQREP